MVAGWVLEHKDPDSVFRLGRLANRSRAAASFRLKQKEA
jgi:hypothetical protein